MALFLSQYFSIFIHLIICSLLSFVFFIFSFILTIQKNDNEKLSAYECGFDPFDDARNTFLFPWCVTLGSLPLFAYWSMFIFLFILTVGFIYEWKKGALEWE